MRADERGGPSGNGSRVTGHGAPGAGLVGRGCSSRWRAGGVERRSVGLVGGAGNGYGSVDGRETFSG